MSGRFAYGTGDTNVGSTTTGVSEASNFRPALYSASVGYEMGPLYATAAYERHKDFQSLNTLLGAAASSGKDDAWKAGLQYAFLGNLLTGRIKMPADGEMRNRAVQHPADFVPHRLVARQFDPLIMGGLFHDRLQHFQDDGDDVVRRHADFGQ